METVERRRVPRQKSFLRGCVYFDKRRGALDCLIRDISDLGARIIFSENVTVPDAVELHIPQRQKTLRAHVQWRRGDEIGLSFPGAERIGPPGTEELMERILQIETEMVSLRKMIKRLKNEIEVGDDVDAA
jgi:PilZ domain